MFIIVIISKKHGISMHIVFYSTGICTIIVLTQTCFMPYRIYAPNYTMDLLAFFWIL